MLDHAGLLQSGDGKAVMGGAYVVTVGFVVKAAHVEDFRTAMIENARTSRADEPGCRQFDVCIDPARPNAVFLYERYDDRAAFEAHLASTHFKTFDALVAPWLEGKTVATYLRVDPA